ncbi:MAG: glutamate-1-semialdehyde 2,1-aminomutase [Candidatus Omnitrophota bacterium]
MKHTQSRKLFREAKRYFPGGVNSPVRAFQAVGGDPLFIRRGRGSRIYDADGNEFIDYVMSWGPLILGHSHPKVVKRIRDVVGKGSSFGAPTELETELARRIAGAMPSIESMRFVNSGTEAAMSAIRLARAYTRRGKIVKFSGCYHGHCDSLLVQAGSGAATLGISCSAGVTKRLAADTIVLPYNDSAAFARAMDRYADEIACVIIEPVAGNMGVVPANKDFLRLLRTATKKIKTLLVFDEVMTGFRVGPGGAQALYGITPDLTCLGKIIGGGFPVGAYGGMRKIMNYIAPRGPVYQAGTLSGNPVAMAAGAETLKILSDKKIYADIEERSALLEKGIIEAANLSKVPATCSRVGSMLTVFFTDIHVENYDGARASDRDRYALYFREMLKRGVYLPPSPFEAMFVSAAHTMKDINSTLKAHEETLTLLDRSRRG